MKALFLDTNEKRALTDLFSAAYPKEKAEALADALLEKYGRLARILQVNQSVLDADIGGEAALYLRLSLSLALRATADRLQVGDLIQRGMKRQGSMLAGATPRSAQWQTLIE